MTKETLEFKWRGRVNIYNTFFANTYDRHEKTEITKLLFPAFGQALDNVVMCLTCLLAHNPPKYKTLVLQYNIKTNCKIQPE